MSDQTFKLSPLGFKLSPLDGTFYKNENGCGVRFERVLNHPAALVWKALTEPQFMEAWLAPVTIEGKVRGTAEGRVRGAVEGGVGARITLKMKGGVMGGKILQWKETKLLEYEWHNGSVVRWELHSEGADSCLLVFTHHNRARDVADDQLIGAATGWHYHMDALTIVLDGKKMPSFPMEAWGEISREAAGRYADGLKTLQ